DAGRDEVALHGGQARSRALGQYPGSAAGAVAAAAARAVTPVGAIAAYPGRIDDDREVAGLEAGHDRLSRPPNAVAPVAADIVEPSRAARAEREAARRADAIDRGFERDRRGAAAARAAGAADPDAGGGGAAAGEEAVAAVAAGPRRIGGQAARGRR